MANWWEAGALPDDTVAPLGPGVNGILPLLSLLGRTSQGLMAGTDKQQIGNVGGVAAQGASNALGGIQYSSLINALMKAAGQTSRDPNTPALGGTSLGVKLDATGQYPTAVNFGTNYKHGEGVNPVPTTASPQKIASTEPVQSRTEPNVGDLLSNYSNFQRALRLFNLQG